MNGNANDENLRKALALYEKEWLASLPSDEELEGMYTMSPRFMRRMARLFSRQSKPYYPYVNRAWKRALIAAVLALLLFAASMSVSAIREPVLRFVIEVYEKFASLFFDTEHVIIERVDYRPTNLPEGYSLKEEELLELVAIVHYENAEGSVISFRQYPLRRVEIQANTEGVAFDEIEINGSVGILYQNKGVNNLVWSEGPNSFWLIANLNKADMTNIALSVQKIE